MLTSTAADPPARTNFPPVPVIDSVNWRPADSTDPVVIASSDLRLLLMANSAHHKWFAWVADQPNSTTAASPNFIGYSDNVNNNKVLDYTVKLRSHLVVIPGSYTVVANPDSTTITCSVTYGTSTTNTNSISAELGVTAGGLSTALNVAFSTEVTVSTETSTTVSRTVEAPPGMTRVWVMWQVVDEIVALAPGDTKVLDNSGRKGWANFAGEGPDDAFLGYQTVQQFFPSEYYLVGFKDFPNS